MEVYFQIYKDHSRSLLPNYLTYPKSLHMVLHLSACFRINYGHFLYHTSQKNEKHGNKKKTKGCFSFHPQIKASVQSYKNEKL